MEHPPLQRHLALQPLSREHFNGLRHARQLAMSAEQGRDEMRSAVEDFGCAWREEIEAHFADEERLLGSLAGAKDRERLLREHETLRALAAQCLATLERGEDLTPDLVRELGTTLYDHIRWEERHLFEAVQQSASAEQLAAIAEQTANIEAVRPGSRRRGAEKKGGCRCGCKCSSDDR